MKEKKLMRKILSFCVALGLALGMLVIPVEKVSATTANQKIVDAKNAVVNILYCVKTPLNEWQPIVSGSGFLVGTAESTQHVITNDHVANAGAPAWADEEVLELMKQYSGESDYTKIETKAVVVVKRDSYIDTEIVTNSAEADICILKMDQPIYNRTVLTLNPTTEPISTEAVYALGFPGVISSNDLDNIYTSDDVTITDGTVSKVAMSNVLTGTAISYIHHTAKISGGNSGGPLMNKDGEVIGINDWISVTDTGENYYFSIQIKEATDLLDAFGIPYNKADGSSAEEPVVSETSEASEASEASETAEPAVVSSVLAESLVEEENNVDELMDELSSEIETAEEKLEAATYTAESAAALEDAISDAKDVYDSGSNATEDQINTAISELKSAEKGLVEKTGPSTTVIIGIVAAVVVLIIVIVLIVVISGNKKKKKAEEEKRKAREAAARQQKTYTQSKSTGGFQQNTPFTPQNTAGYADEGSNPTGVLNEGSNATTVLGNTNIPAASLIRKKTGEKVTVSKSVFKIGKERRKVDYCISDNTNVSRTHADIIFKNGRFYIVDNNTTNGTSVNGVKVAAGQERPLNGNETIRLADEEFQFRLG